MIWKSPIRVIFFVVLLACFPLAARTGPPAAVSSQPAEISVSGFLSDSQVTEGESTRFWISVRNSSSASVFRIQLDELYAPGFQISQLHGSDKNSVPCSRATQNSTPAVPSWESADIYHCEVVIQELKPNQLIAFWGDLNAVHSQKNSGITASVDWQGADKTESVASVKLGECTVTLWWERTWSRVSAFAQNFSVPVVLLILGWAFQRRDKTREEARQVSERRLEESKHEMEQRRTQMAEQWSIMLPDSRRLSRRYYLPFLSSVTQAIADLTSIRELIQIPGDQQVPVLKSEVEKQLTEIARRAFFDWVLCWRHVRNVGDSVGGLHFKDRIGEQLTSRCLNKLIELYFEGESLRRAYGRILDKVDIRERLDGFLTKLESSDNEPLATAFQEAWKHFSAWTHSPACAKSILYLRGLAALIEYEANRPLEYWYGGVKEKLVLDHETEEALLQVAEETALRERARSDFKTKAQAYITEGKASS